MRIIGSWVSCIALLVAAFFAGPECYKLFAHAIPPLAQGVNAPTLEYGVSRVLAVVSVCCVLLASRPQRAPLTLAAAAKRFLGECAYSGAMSLLLILIATTMDFGTWFDRGYPLDFAGDRQRALTEFLALPLNVLLGPLRLSITVDPASQIAFAFDPSLNFYGDPSNAYERWSTDAAGIAFFAALLALTAVYIRGSSSERSPLFRYDPRVLVGTAVAMWACSYAVMPLPAFMPIFPFAAIFAFQCFALTVICFPCAWLILSRASGGRFVRDDRAPETELDEYMAAQDTASVPSGRALRAIGIVALFLGALLVGVDSELLSIFAVLPLCFIAIAVPRLSALRWGLVAAIAGCLLAWVCCHFTTGASLIP